MSRPMQGGKRSFVPLMPRARCLECGKKGVSQKNWNCQYCTASFGDPSKYKSLSALRNRTSEPEAGEVETLGPSAGFWSNVITHPAPATADKLKVAVEALKSAREDLIAFATARGSEYEGTREDATYEIDQALAALNEQPQ